MTAIVWDLLEDIRYEAGLDRGVLYPITSPPVAWNGLVAVNETVENSETYEFYYNGVRKYVDISPGDFAATLEALTYPDAFLEFDGWSPFDEVSGIFIDNQPRKTFHLSYRTLVGDTVDGVDFAYKIHLLYNLVAEPSSANRKTLSDSIDPNIFSWDLKSVPITVDGRAPSAHIVLDSRKMYATTLAAVEDILYGTATTAPRMITPAEIADLTTIEIIDNGDGTWTAIGPDEYVYADAEDGVYIIESLGISPVDEDTYTITSS